MDHGGDAAVADGRRGVQVDDGQGGRKGRYQLVGLFETLSQGIQGEGMLLTGARGPDVAAGAGSFGGVEQDLGVGLVQGLDEVRDVARLVFLVTRRGIASGVTRAHVDSLFECQLNSVMVKSRVGPPRSGQSCESVKSAIQTIKCGSGGNSAAW